MIARPLSIDAALVEELAVGKHPEMERLLVDLARKGTLKGVVKKPARYSVGDRVGCLTLVEFLPLRKNNNRYWSVRCDCGNNNAVSVSNLRSGKTNSCGCVGNTKHGEARRAHTSPEYKVWHAMHERCTNKRNQQFKHYGARGITVCARWKDVHAFIKDVGRRPGKDYSLDRIDTNKNYEPGNVRWATAKTQARNRRNNYKLTYRGVTKLVIEWAEEFGLQEYTLKSRLRHGWSAEDALHTPARRWVRAQ
ncbi:MAG: hypothetical protein IT381_28290 [Deltaproteobacteria bacterium]|nr:hypothetical protein [Deltaproteobacteria bacterium]